MSRRALAWAVVATLVPVTATAQLPEPDLRAVEPAVREAVQRAIVGVEEAMSSAAAWGELGMVLHAHRFLDEADVAYSQAIEHDSSEFRWPYFRAALHEFRDPERSVELYSAAMRIDPRYVPGLIRWAEALEKVGRVDDAYERYRDAARLDQREPLAVLGLGRIELGRNEIESAVANLRRAYQLSPETQAIVATYARALARQGDRQQARQLAQQARALPRLMHHRDPRRASVDALAVDSESFLRRSRTYREVGQPQRALEEVGQLLGRDPNHAAAHFVAAGVYDELGRPRDAVRSVQRALELDPDIEGAPEVLAGALFKSGDFAAAKQATQRVLDADPDNVHALLLSSMMAGREGDVAAHVQALDHAFRVGTSELGLRRLMSGLLVDLADALADVGERQEALRRVDQALTLGVGDSSALEARRARWSR